MAPLEQTRVSSLPHDNAPVLQARPRADNVRNGRDEERSLYVYIFIFIIVAFSVMIGIFMHCYSFNAAIISFCTWLVYFFCSWKR